MMKKWLLKKQEKDYFTSAQIILTCPFFLNYYSALALVSSTLFGNILNHSSSYTKGNWRERQNGRRDEWKIHSPSLSLCVSHTRGVCVCVFVNEAPPQWKRRGEEWKKIIIIKVSPTVLGPMAETSSCFNFRSYRSIVFFFVGRLATNLLYVY